VSQVTTDFLLFKFFVAVTEEREIEVLQVEYVIEFSQPAGEEHYYVLLQ